MVTVYLWAHWIDIPSGEGTFFRLQAIAYATYPLGRGVFNVTLSHTIMRYLMY